VITQALIESKALTPSSLYIYNRTVSKAAVLKESYPGVQLARNCGEVINNCRLVFICVKPKDIYPLLAEYRNQFEESQCVVSITSPVSTTQLESILPCSCARVIPSITNRALAGVSLYTLGENCSSEWEERIIHLLRYFSHPVNISEEVTRVASDIVSCGPAFFSYLTRRFIEGAVKETTIDEETATILTTHMLIGLGDLLKKGFYTLPTLQEKVSVKGGITGEGIHVLERETGEMFEKLFRATHHKFDEDLAETSKQFGV
ncbi:MAG TPA: late competence protein ComER, partial [Chondromyces sp.]|nr:late competence protein ComER [Chondromyces sp.]